MDKKKLLLTVWVMSFIGSVLFGHANPVPAQPVNRNRKDWGQPLVQPLKLHILQVKVLPQELPIYLGSDIRLRRR